MPLPCGRWGMIPTMNHSEAFVLHVRPYLETSALISLYTEQNGWLNAIAKGCRRPKNPLKGLLQPFQKITLSWLPKPTLSLIVEADLSEWLHPTTQMGRMAGFYVNELLYRLLPNHEVIPTLFTDYIHTVQHLDTPELDPILRIFEHQLLSAMGYAIDCDADEAGLPIRVGGYYRYHPTQRFIEVPQGQEGISGESILALGRNMIELPHYRDIKKILQLALHIHLSGKPLQSQALIRSWLNDKTGG